MEILWICFVVVLCQFGVVGLGNFARCLPARVWYKLIKLDALKGLNTLWMGVGFTFKPLKRQHWCRPF
jgi:hypothetical protein